MTHFKSITKNAPMKATDTSINQCLQGVKGFVQNPAGTVQQLLQKGTGS